MSVIVEGLPSENAAKKAQEVVKFDPIETELTKALDELNSKDCSSERVDQLVMKVMAFFQRLLAKTDHESNEKIKTLFDYRKSELKKAFGRDWSAYIILGITVVSSVATAIGGALAQGGDTVVAKAGLTAAGGAGTGIAGWMETRNQGHRTLVQHLFNSTDKMSDELKAAVQRIQQNIQGYLGKIGQNDQKRSELTTVLLRSV